MTPPLRRHQLAHPCPEGWARLLASDWDGEARSCLAHWAGHDLPLVVTRQPAPRDGVEPGIALGLPAPLRWGRRRLALRMSRAEIARFEEFPNAEAVLDLLPQEARAAWQALTGALAARGAPARVHGSHGWQKLSGLDCLRPTSDLDLWIAVGHADRADRVAACLQDFAAPHPRLDAELVFDDGGAVHWREWQAWRQGRARGVLVRRLDGAAIAATAFSSGPDDAPAGPPV